MGSSSSSSNVATDWPPPPNFTHEQLQDIGHKIALLSKAAVSMGMERRGVHNTQSKIMLQIKHIESTYKERQLTAAAAATTLDSTTSRSMNEVGTCEEKEGPRYLFLLHGREICALDLKQSKDAKPIMNVKDIPTLPKAATLKLMEDGLPVLAGLFKLGSHAYMIGGQEVPTQLNVESICNINELQDPYTDLFWHRYPGRLNGTSRAWYRLSVPDDDKRALAACECNMIGNMKRPKVWPIVEEIEGEIHVFDSSPAMGTHSPDWVFSHEVLKRGGEDDGGEWCWAEIPTKGGPVNGFIDSHLVLGRRIYARSELGRKSLLFDSRERTWELADVDYTLDKYNLRTAWDIMSYLNVGRCVLDVEVGENHLYVVIAFWDNAEANPESDDYRYDPDLDVTTTAMACLVNSTGEVVCTQFLPHFFDSTTLAQDPILPFGMQAGRIIKVDAEGKTMCALVRADGDYPGRDHYLNDHNYLFMVTFSVKMLPGAAFRYGTGKGPKIGEFVQVDIKDSFIYNVDARPEDRIDGHGMQACFL